MSDELTPNEPQVHIRFEGRSIDITASQIDIGALSSDEEVRRAIANFLSVPVQKLQAFAVDRSTESGHLTLRPEAVFGG